MKKPDSIPQTQEHIMKNDNCTNRYLFWGKRFAFFAVGIIALYTILWAIIAIGINYRLNASLAQKKWSIDIWDNKTHSIAFKKATLYGFPFKIGTKITDVIEENDDGVITHQEPIYFGYDVIKQRFYTSYDGVSIARAKPIESGFGSEIHGKYHYYLSCPLSIGLTKILINPDSQFELINFVKSISFVASDIKVYDLVDKSMTFDAKKITMSLKILERPYYQSLEELQSDIPQSYHFVSDIAITQSAYGRKIAPVSIIYGAFPMSAFTSGVDVELTTSAKKFDLVSIVKNMDLKVNKMQYTDQAQNSDVSIAYTSKSTNDDINISCNYSDILHIQDGFAKYQLGQLKMEAKELLQSDSIGMFKPALDSFLQNPQKYLPDLTNVSQIQDTLVFDLVGKGLAFDLNIKDIGTMVNNTTGYNANGIFHIDNDLQWKASGQLLLSNYKNIVNFVLDYGNKLQQTPIDQDALNMIKESVQDTLKAVSNHPDSKSNNVALDYELNSNDESKIGTHTFNQILEIYYKSLYRNAIIIAQKAPNFIKKLQELLPDASPELIESLKKHSEDHVIQPLAK